jgi:NurA domain
MPLKPSQILQQLQAKREDFSNFDEETSRLLEMYRSALTKAMKLGDGEIRQKLQTIGDCGATPAGLLTGKPWILPFGMTWSTREESLNWVREKLLGISTFAVDGSQIYPGKDLSIPVALVQIGWYENLHVPGGEYIKDIATDVLTPNDLRTEKGEMADRKVNLRRFQMETERIVTYFEEHRGSDTALAFFDGSLVVSFAEVFEEETRMGYVNAMNRLLEASEHFQVPVVGYIDTSAARDLTTMIRHLYRLPEAPTIHDAQLLMWKKLGGMEWGDCLELFQCQRSGILAKYSEKARPIVFTYLKTNRESPPARLEFPKWVLDKGRMPEVLDWVRSEVVIGSGYPYVIETADQVAVVSNSDRQMFFKILQDWAKEESLTIRLARKVVSKMRRR